MSTFTETVTAEDFDKAVRKHDMTYFYSDARNAYRAGLESFKAIEKMAKRLPKRDAVRIWNSVVDERVAEGYREPFYWKE